MPVLMFVVLYFNEMFRIENCILAYNIIFKIDCISKEIEIMKTNLYC